MLVDTPPALGAHVQLHAPHVAVIRVSASPPVGSQTTQLLTAHAANWVVWIEQGSEARIAYAANHRGSIELVRAELGTPIAELERVVALKLAGLLDPPPPPSRPPEPPAQRWRLGIGGAVVGGDDRGLAGGPAIVVGRRIDLDSWLLAIELRGRWLRSGTIEQRMTSVSVDEASLGIQLEVASAIGRFELLANGGVAGTLFRASGQSADGRSGAATVGVPTFYGHVGTRVYVGGATVGVETGLEIAGIRQRFIVDGSVGADLERIRFVGSLWVAVAFR